MQQRKRVTKARADRVILAIVDLIECDNIHDYGAMSAYPNALSVLGKAADIAREIRENAPSRSVSLRDRPN